MKTAYPILQSGFLAKSEVGLTKISQPEEEKIIKAIELGKPFDTNGNPFFFNAELDKLCVEYEHDNRIVRNFDFREKILLQAKNAMPFGKFSDWLLFQEESPYLSKLHRRFINDTIKFILRGERELGIESWAGLIYPTLKQLSDVGEVYNQDTEFFIRDIDPDLGRVMAMWTSHSNGWHDLIMFLDIVFTAKTSRTL